MNEEPTKDLPLKPSFEDRVFARFDGMDARLGRLESRAYDTKPIWEKALAHIMETGLEVGEIKARVSVIESDVAEVKTELAEVKTELTEVKTELTEVKAELTEVKTEVATMRSDYVGIKSELTDMKREIKHQVNKRLDLILEFLLEGRDDLRDAEQRIRQLETKLA
jgi:chromosome segregation ATPase